MVARTGAQIGRIACLCLVIASFMSRTSGSKTPSHAAAELTLAILRAQVAPKARVQGYTIRPSLETSSLDQAVRRLVSADKPLRCRASLVRDVLDVECQSIHDRRVVRQRRSRAEDLGLAYRRLLDEQCQHANGEHQVQVVVGGQALLLPFSAVESWIREYDMPYTLPMWTRARGDLPKGVCARMVVRPTPTIQIQVEYDNPTRRTD